MVLVRRMSRGQSACSGQRDWHVQSPRGRRCQVRRAWTLRHTGSGPFPELVLTPSLLSSSTTWPPVLLVQAFLRPGAWAAF